MAREAAEAKAKRQHHTADGVMAKTSELEQSLSNDQLARERAETERSPALEFFETSIMK